jgi:ketosteroid isomerase-like protein
MEICRQSYVAIDEGRMEDLYASLADEFAYEYLGAVLPPQSIKSADDYRQFRARIADVYESLELAELEFFEVAPDKVLVTCERRTVRKGQEEVESQPVAWLWTFRDGKYFSGIEYLDLAEAKRENGLA